MRERETHVHVLKIKSSSLIFFLKKRKKETKLFQF